MEQKSPRILITRLSAVGDCVHTMPLVGALRKHFPRAFIAWVTQGGPATLLHNYPGLDRVIVVPRGYLKSVSTVWRVRRELRSLNFNIAIDPQSLTKSSILGWLSGARHRIGFAAPQGRELALWLNSDRIHPRRTHVVERYLELLRPLVGDTPLSAEFQLPHSCQPAVDAFMNRLGNSPKFAVINPGAGWDSKLWLPERFAEVAQHLLQHHNLPSVVVWAGEREQAWAEQIVRESQGAAIMAPDTTLPELAAILRRAQLCVAADTGPLHLAAAVDTPCVGLYGTTRPCDCGPYGLIHQSVQAYYHDGSARERRTATNDAMRAIEVHHVTQACDQVLAAVAQARHVA